MLGIEEFFPTPAQVYPSPETFVLLPGIHSHGRVGNSIVSFIIFAKIVVV